MLCKLHRHWRSIECISDEANCMFLKKQQQRAQDCYFDVPRTTRDGHQSTQTQGSWCFITMDTHQASSAFSAYPEWTMSQTLHYGEKYWSGWGPWQVPKREDGGLPTASGQAGLTKKLRAFRTKKAPESWRENRPKWMTPEGLGLSRGWFVNLLENTGAQRRGNLGHFQF